MVNRRVHPGRESLRWVDGVGWSDRGCFLSPLLSPLPCISQMKSESGIAQTFISDKYKRETFYITEYAEHEHHKENCKVAPCSSKELSHQTTLLKTNMKYWSLDGNQCLEYGIFNGLSHQMLLAMPALGQLAQVTASWSYLFENCH